MLSITQQQEDRQWDIMPEKLREALYSPAYAETVFQIAHDHHLNEIKAEQVVRLVGYVMFGLLHSEELDEELIKTVDVPRTTAEEIADAVDRKVFTQFREEINELYTPIAEDEEGIVTTSEKTETTPDKEGDEQYIPIRSHRAEEPNKQTSDGDPLVIHQEESPQTTPQTKRKFSFPLGGFFEPSQSRRSTESSRARVETPFSQPQKKEKENEKKVVHYSEYRSQPTDNGQGFIDLSRFNPQTKQVPQMPTKPSAAAPQKTSPQVEGNTVDLRK